VARLSHPHIVTVIDAGEDDGTPYIVFEYVEGETLKQRIRRLGRLEIPEAVAYAIEIARALGAAHDCDIVHRDVKPQNVLIDRDGRALITDFGIARTLTEEGLTADGRVLGTTDYVSPEQALGQGVSGQSDLYALGVVLFEMLTGDVPFKAENQVAVAMKHVRDELPDVQQRRPEVSSALAAVLDRATAKDPRERYRDAPAMIAGLEDALALETLRSGHSTGEATSVLRTLPGSAQRRLPLRLRSPLRLVLAAVALLAVGVAVAVYAVLHTHSGVGPPPNVAPPSAASAVPLAQNAAHAYNPYGTGDEHNATQAQFAVDGDPNTYWTTYTYQGAALGKPGTGLYVDASPGVAAAYVVLQTPTPGFVAQVWASNAIREFGSQDLTESLEARGWQRIDLGDQTVTDGQRIRLDTAENRFKYYLVWIKQLPPGRASAALSGITLYK
jgi:serine/threonine-protein kinase